MKKKIKVRLDWPPFIFICESSQKQIVLSVFRSKLSDENSFQPPTHPTKKQGIPETGLLYTRSPTERTSYFRRKITDFNEFLRTQVPR